MPALRVLHISWSDSQGGAGKAAYRLHKSLNEAGLDSIMVVQKKGTLDPTVICPVGIISRFFNTVATVVNRLPLLFRRPHIYGSTAVAGLPMASILRKHKPDIVHCHWVGGGVLRIESLQKIKVPIVWRMPDMWLFCGAEHYAGSSMRHREGYQKSNRSGNERGLDIDRWVFARKVKTFARINRLYPVAPSQWLASEARASKLLAGREVEVIPTGINTVLFCPKNREDARRELGLDGDAHYILFGADNFDSDIRKGFAYAQEVARILHAMNLHCSILTFGKKMEQETLGGLPVVSLGHISDIQTLSSAYSASNVFLATSIEENLANTVLESIACGTPVVAFDIGGMPDAIVENISGTCVPLGDCTAMAEAVKKILDIKNGEKELSESCRSYAQDNYTQAAQCDRYSALYHRITR